MNKILLFFLAAIVTTIFSCSKGGEASTDSGDSKINEGKGGSTARITVVGDFLYAVDNTSLKIVNISDAKNPTYVKTINIGFGIETIYPFKGYLFLGSNTGMYVFTLLNPSDPILLTEFKHATACDPVIANDSLAFITLRYNEICGRWNKTKEIDVVDITNIKSPKMINIYPTYYNPYGLDMNDSILFVCHGKNGLIAYDIQKIINNNAVAEISSVHGIFAYDAILWQNKLFIIGETGFYQYDYSDIHNIKLISSIPRGH